jgi:hypothetical protein
MSQPVPDPNKPSMFFSGGNIQQVRGAAMGAAVTQGWEVKKAGRDSLILQRNLDDTAAENLAPGASRGPLPPVIEVRTDFFDRSGGVEVQLGAEAVTARGTNKEVRQDYTETYRNELTHSLSILQNSWHEAGPRIANALPPIGGMRDAAPTDSPVSESLANPAPVTPPSYSMIDIPDEEAEDSQPSSAATWSLPPAAAATATATAVARANTLPSKTTPITPVTKISQAPKSAPPAKAATQVAAAPVQSLILKPTTTQATGSMATLPKSLPIFPKPTTTTPSGKPAATTAQKLAPAGTAKSPTVAAGPKSATAVTRCPQDNSKDHDTGESDQGHRHQAPYRRALQTLQPLPGGGKRRLIRNKSPRGKRGPAHHEGLCDSDYLQSHGQGTLLGPYKISFGYYQFQYIQDQDQGQVACAPCASGPIALRSLCGTLARTHWR